MSEGTRENGVSAVNERWAAELVDELARCGLRHCCVSPGSRSTPLVVQFDAHPDIEEISIIDERAAGFYALGLARATDRPVALVCTSGTAAANWMPAVCEADRSRVPLLLLTADRPPELRDTGSPQSMDQLKLYGDRVRWFHEFGRPEAETDSFRYMLSAVDLAWERARQPVPGPVHLNLPFRKPLEPLDVEAGHRDAVPADFDVPARRTGTTFSGFSTGVRVPDEPLTGEFVERLSGAKRPMFLCGADHRGEAYREGLRDLADAVGAPVLAEPTSGLRFWKERGDVIGVGDYLVDSGLYDRVGEPDVVVRTGEAPLTWAGRRFVQGLAGAHQISVQRFVQRRDPDHVVDWNVVADERRLFEASRDRLSDGIPDVEQGWSDAHRRAAATATETLAESLGQTNELEEPRMWWELQRLLPSPASLFVSNSMPVRNIDMYAPGGDGEIDVYFNRGLNGIDGIASTGLGVAKGTAMPTVVVTGDVAFRHDIGGLALAQRTDANVAFVVVDNGGGAIFDMLPIAECGSVHDRHFVTEPGIDIAGVGTGFGASVSVPTTWEEFREDVRRAVEADGVDLVWLRTDRARDKRRGDEIRRAVVDAIDQG